MDDGIIIYSSKIILKELLEDIKIECMFIGIKLNDTKSWIYKLKEGFTYLGFRFILNDNGKIIMKLPTIKKRRIKKYINSLDNTSKNIRIVFYKDYLLKGNNYNFYNKIKLIN